MVDYKRKQDFIGRIRKIKLSKNLGWIHKVWPNHYYIKIIKYTLRVIIAQYTCLNPVIKPKLVARTNLIAIQYYFSFKWKYEKVSNCGIK